MRIHRPSQSSIVVRLVAAAAVLAARGVAAEPVSGSASGPGIGEVVEIQGRPPRAGTLDDLVSDDPTADDAERALDDPAFVSEVALGRRAGERVALAALVAESVGAAVRAAGAAGSYATLSVRGAAPGHTQVVLDGVPLARLGSAAVDLGRLELGGYATVELYRGGAPGVLGGAAGSALHLTTQVGPSPGGRRLRLDARTGSFGDRHLGARYLGGDAALGWMAAAAYDGARGDFAYFDDRGTNLQQADDRESTRANAGYDAVEGAVRIRRRGDTSASGGVRIGWRDQGVPGPGSHQSMDASLAGLRATADATVQRAGLAGGAVGASGTVFALVERQRFRDLGGEVGIGRQDRRYRTLSGGALGEATVALDERQRLALAGEARLERFDETDLLGDVPRGAAGRRLGGALDLADDVDLARGVVALRPSLRLEWVRTRPPAEFDAAIDPMAPTTRDDLIAAPRLGVRVALGPIAAVKAGAGRYLRLPTALELYGDRGTTVGNPALEAERGWAGDLGAVVAPDRRHGAFDRLYLEAVGFATRSSDTIALVPTAALVVVPMNLGDARTVGLELSGAVRVAGAISLLAHYTAMTSRQRDTLPSYEGKELPHRPRHRFFGRAELAGRARDRLLVAWSDVDVTAGNHLDPANLDEVPGRALVGLGGKAEAWPGALVGVSVDNLLDRRTETVALDPPPRPDLTRVPRAISDFFGYPLPGRAIYLNLELELL